MDILVSISRIVLPILIIGLLIFIHELGHFLAARSVGVKVEKFALGFGPTLWKKQIGETEYSLRLIFLGGYVQMYGDLDPSSTTKDLSLAKDPRSVISKSVLEKIWISSAGVLMNFLFAIFAFFIYLMAVEGVVAVQKIGDYKFLGAEQTPNLISLSADFREEGAKTGIVLEMNGQIPQDRAQLVSLLEDNYNEEVAVKIFSGSDIEEVKLVLNGDGIKSNFDLDLFPVKLDNATEEAASGRLVIVSIDDKAAIADGLVIESDEAIDLPASLEGTKFKDYIKGENKLPMYLISVDSKQITSVAELNSTLKNSLGETVNLQLMNGEGESVQVIVALPEKVEGDEPILGVGLGISNLGFDSEAMVFRYPNPFLGAPLHTINSVGYNAYALGILIGDAFKGEPEGLTDNVGGVVAIGGQIGEVVDAAAKIDKRIIIELFNVTGLISVMLAFMNILPIPVLDGGHILFILIEKVRGKPITPKLQNAIYIVFFVLLVGLSVLVTVRDVLDLL